MFIVTGRREDVEMAKREIVSAAEHFSMIRASRCKAGAPGGGGSLPGPPHLPGQTTIQVQEHSDKNSLQTAEIYKSSSSNIKNV